MAIIGNTALTLVDWARRQDPDGKIAKIAELLNLTNEVLDDMLWVEGNLPTGHRTTIRTGLPSATWRLLNYGVVPSKATTTQVTDACGMLEAYSEIDKSLADLNGNTAEFRLSEDKAFIEAMNQQFCTTLFYGNSTTTPASFTGLSARYPTVNPATALNAQNVFDGGGTASTNTSIWLVVWDENTVSGIFPKGGFGGLKHEDLGEQTLYDYNVNKLQGYRTHYKWDCGLTLRDWRYVVRIANIDVTLLTKNAASGTDLIDQMTAALERVQSLKMGRPVFYCSRLIKSFLRRQIANKVLQSTLQMDTVSGKHVMTFGDVPVRRVDAILNTEARVV